MSGGVGINPISQIPFPSLCCKMPHSYSSRFAFYSQPQWPSDKKGQIPVPILLLQALIKFYDSFNRHTLRYGLLVCQRFLVPKNNNRTKFML